MATEVGVAALVVDAGGSHTVELAGAPRVRGASVVKPLLAWTAADLAPFADDRSAWRASARPAITTSDNDATHELWSRAGGDEILTSLQARVGVRWDIDPIGSEHPSLRLMVTAEELARAYAQLVADRAAVATEIRAWMREVPEAQTFGLRRVACDALGVEDAVVGVKCGWFGGARAHAVVLVELTDRIVGAAVTTSGVPDAGALDAVGGAIGDDTKLAAAHDELYGPTVRSAAYRALTSLR